MAYKLYDLETKKVAIAVDARFFENEFPNRHTPIMEASTGAVEADFESDNLETPNTSARHAPRAPTTAIPDTVVPPLRPAPTPQATAPRAPPVVAPHPTHPTAHVEPQANVGCATPVPRAPYPPAIRFAQQPTTQHRYNTRLQVNLNPPASAPTLQEDINMEPADTARPTTFRISEPAARARQERAVYPSNGLLARRNQTHETFRRNLTQIHAQGRLMSMTPRPVVAAMTAAPPPTVAPVTQPQPLHVPLVRTPQHEAADVHTYLPVARPSPREQAMVDPPAKSRRTKLGERGTVTAEYTTNTATTAPTLAPANDDHISEELDYNPPNLPALEDHTALAAFDFCGAVHDIDDPAPSSFWEAMQSVKGIYGTHQGGLMWYPYCKDTLHDMGFEETNTDPCVFLRRIDDEVQIIT
ncbi:hypothetical protein DYB37_013115, partial [Aphanomyces astaci]